MAPPRIVHPVTIGSLTAAGGKRSPCHLHTIDPTDPDLLFITDSPQEAMARIVESLEHTIPPRKPKRRLWFLDE